MDIAVSGAAGGLPGRHAEKRPPWRASWTGWCVLPGAGRRQADQAAEAASRAAAGSASKAVASAERERWITGNWASGP